MAEESKRREIARSEERMDYFQTQMRRIVERIPVAEVEGRVARRQRRINDLRSRVESLERRLPILATVDRWITRRVIISLRRSLRALEGWQTRERRILRRYGVWFYWFHWWRVRRAEWQTRLWLQTLRAFKVEAERGVTVERADAIRTQLTTIEGGIEWILAEIKETERIAKEREWKVGWPRPYPTMARWISSVYGRLSPIRRLIREILELLLARWIEFAYVIYYAYTLPGGERHLEAHFESQCYDNEAVKDAVKTLASSVLRRWVTSVKYAVPLLSGLTAEVKGKRVVGLAEWEWGVQWGESKTETKREVHLRLEVYDYDYDRVRREAAITLPLEWWKMGQRNLERRIGI